MLPELNDLDAWLATGEARIEGIRAGCAKQIVWADGVKKTPISIVYVHGFSATGEEVRPLPDIVAKALGANVYFARLTGHGQDGAAMGRARMSDWDVDIAQALEIGAALGDEIIVMGCSTGCTVLTTAMAKGAQVKGAVFVSPNFGMRQILVQALLQMPGVRHWGRFVAGKERSFEVISQGHEDFWTVKYDTQAVFTMADSVRAAWRSPVARIQTPAYVAFAQTDQVVSPKKTRRIMARWGGPVREDVLVQGPEDDKMGHVMAGDVFSPKQTAPLAARIIEWAKTL